MAKLITYDLCRPGTNYQKLENYIVRTFPNRYKVNESCWLVSGCSLTCQQIQTALWNLTDANDKIFVASLTGESAWKILPVNNQTTNLIKAILHYD